MGRFLCTMALFDLTVLFGFDLVTKLHMSSSIPFISVLQFDVSYAAAQVMSTVVAGRGSVCQKLPTHIILYRGELLAHGVMKLLAFQDASL